LEILSGDDLSELSPFADKNWRLEAVGRIEFTMEYEQEHPKYFRGVAYGLAE